MARLLFPHFDVYAAGSSLHDLSRTNEPLKQLVSELRFRIMKCDDSIAHDGSWHGSKRCVIESDSSTRSAGSVLRTELRLIPFVNPPGAHHTVGYEGIAACELLRRLVRREDYQCALLRICKRTAQKKRSPAAKLLQARTMYCNMRHGLGLYIIGRFIKQRELHWDLLAVSPSMIVFSRLRLPFSFSAQSNHQRESAI